MSRELFPALSDAQPEKAKSRGHFRALMHVSELLNSTLHLDQLLELIMDIVIEALEAERGFLMLVNPETGQLNFPVARNLDRQNIAGPEFEISRSVVNRVARTGEPVLTLNAEEDERFQAYQSILDYHLRSILCVPLKLKGQVTGAIYIDNRLKAGAFSNEDLDFLTSFANLAAVAIENARLFNRLQSNLAETSRLKSLMDNIFASIASGVVTVGPHGRITMVNRAASQLLGQPREALVDKPLEEALPWLVIEPIPDALLQIVRGEKDVITLPFSAHLPGRGQVHFKLTLSRLRGATGGGIVLAIEDQTLETLLQQDREREARAREQLQAMLQRYLSPSVAQKLAAMPASALTLGGERQEITVLFADLRGFSTLVEQTPPEEMVHVLNRYLGLAVDAIFAEEGTLDKFLGDAILAFFNAPVRQPDHLMRALRAALAIQEKVRRSWDTFPEPFRLQFGIGISAGEAIVGHIGTEDRMDFTAVGDCVNVAERLQEVAEPGQILVSHAVYERVKDVVDVRSVQSVTLRGRQTRILAYELLGLRRPK
jgi:PAS domain S-box-containing protein